MIFQGDCLEILRQVHDNTFDAIVTDPPYGLSKEPDAAEVLAKWLAGEDYQHTGGGFMGKSWDSFVPGPSIWRECLRVLKPGGHLLSFFGTRTYDLGTMAIRLAGFEIRDQLAWMYGSGFPKSKNVAMSIDKGEGMIGHRSVAAVTGGIGDNSRGRGPDLSVGPYVPEPGSPGEPWAGWGTAIKPAQEPIVLARKPLIGTVAANVLAHGTGGLNVDGCRIGGETRYNPPAGNKPGTHSYNMGVVGMPRDANGKVVVGRWPANVLLDEEAAAVLDEQTASLKGGASRFFYVAKASRSEREAGLDHLPIRTPGQLTDREDGSDGLNSPRAGAGRSSGRRNHHPTVKPIALMRHLVRLITPPGGLVLDPFCGSGSTGCAAVLEGVHFVGLELDPEYVAIAEARLAHAQVLARIS